MSDYIVDNDDVALSVKCLEDWSDMLRTFSRKRPLHASEVSRVQSVAAKLAVILEQANESEAA